MGILALGAILFRKNVANDLLNMPFSMIGSIAIGEIAFFVSTFGVAGHHLILKWALLSGIVGVLLGGFICGNLFGDGESSGGSGQ